MSLKGVIEVETGALRRPLALKILYSCDCCGALIEHRYKKRLLDQFLGGTRNSFCSIECKNNSSRKGGADRIRSENTCLEKYGFLNSAQNEEVKRKIVKTCLDRYGASSYLKTPEARESLQDFCARHGVSDIGYIPEIREKRRLTCQRNFGVDYPTSSPIVQAKIRVTLTKNYGSDHFFRSPLGREMSTALFRSDAFKKHRMDVLKKSGYFKRSSSFEEDRIFEKLRVIFPNTERQIPIHKWTIDFYVPEIATYVNFNGVYWHGRYDSEEFLTSSSTKQSKVILGTKNRDRERRTWFDLQGLLFFEIWEDSSDSDIDTLVRGDFRGIS